MAAPIHSFYSRRQSITSGLAALALALVPLSLVAAESSDSNSPSPAVPAGQRVVLVTGSTDGLGREVALRLAASGAHVIVHGRNRERGAEVVRQIEQGGKGSARFYAADFSSLAQVREFANAILRDYDRLDVLVNNAGIWLSGDRRQLSTDGQEMHFAVNYLSGFLLTRMLLPKLIASVPARIVNVSSGAQQALDFDNLTLERNYSDSRGYATSKLAQVLFTFDLAGQLAGTGVTVNALHPATLMNTTMVADHNIAPQSSVDEGAAAVLNLVNSPAIGTGGFFNGQRRASPQPQANDDRARRQLREISERLTSAPPIPATAK